MAACVIDTSSPVHGCGRLFLPSAYVNAPPLGADKAKPRMLPSDVTFKVAAWPLVAAPDNVTLHLAASAASQLRLPMAPSNGAVSVGLRKQKTKILDFSKKNSKTIRKKSNRNLRHASTRTARISISYMKQMKK